MQVVKVVVVGDAGVGKTSALVSYTRNYMPSEYVPVVFDNYSQNVTHNGRVYSMHLHDTAGQCEYDRLRPLVYPDTQVFICMFDLASQASFVNIKHKWVPEIRQHCPKAQMILVGNKYDLKKDYQQLPTLAEHTHNTCAVMHYFVRHHVPSLSSRSAYVFPFHIMQTLLDFASLKVYRPEHIVSLTQAQDLARDIGVFKYVECSALTWEGLEQVFLSTLDAFQLTFDRLQNSTKTAKKCTLL